jgi:hypothetical protein
VEWGFQDPLDEDNLKPNSWIYEKIPSGGIKNFVGDIETGIEKKIYSPVENALGFNENYCDFIYPSLLIGILTGLWIWLIYFIASWTEIWSMIDPLKRLSQGIAGKKDVLKTKLESSWLGFIASSPWKIIPLALAYATIMQIPILNTFIYTITFAPLGLGIIFQSIILAFYIGFLPSAIEPYTRYKLRKKYYEKVLQAKYQGKGLRELLGMER